MLRIGTLSIVVNALCNLKCLHCDLPRHYQQYGKALGVNEWEVLVGRLCDRLRPKNLTVGAMEPLLPPDQKKTATIISTAINHGVNTGLITNGMFIEQFHRSWPGIKLDFLDISVEGPEEIDRMIRGDHHFRTVEKVLELGIPQRMAPKFYISCCLNDINIPHLPKLLEWVREKIRNPRIVLIALYSNQNVDPQIRLSESSLRFAIEVAANIRGFKEIILDFFPTAPGLKNLRQEGVLPDTKECKIDSGGVECGWVRGEVFARFYDLNALLLHQLRVSPEGHALPPSGYENSDYLKSSLGSLVEDDWSTIEQRILESNQQERR